MKAELYKLHPQLEHADDTAVTLEALIMAAREAWHAIDQRILYKVLKRHHAITAILWYNPGIANLACTGQGFGLFAPQLYE